MHTGSNDDDTNRPRHQRESFSSGGFVEYFLSDAWAYIKNVLIALPAGTAFMLGLVCGHGIAG